MGGGISMQIGFIVLLMFMFSWFTPLVTIISHIIVGLALGLRINIPWSVITMLDTIMLIAVNLLLIMILRKGFDKIKVRNGILVFAVLNFLAGLTVFQNPVSMVGTFYQMINFLSNVILSNFVFILEKPYILLLPIFTLLIHLTINYIIEYRLKKIR